MPSLTLDQYDLLILAIAWIGGFAPMLWRRDWTWAQAIGLGLVVTPFARMALDVYVSIAIQGALFTHTVLQPVSAEALWRSVGARALDYGLVPLAGLLVLHNAVPGWRSRRAPPMTATAALAAEGVAPRASWRRDAARGLALFLFIAAAEVVALVLSRTALAALSSNGDESRYWQNVTIPLIVLLSGVAGLTEEFLFRGILLTRLSKVMPWIAAAVAQAALFALIHSGYGTWSHLLGPFVFGFGMAWVARNLGVVVTALLHAEVNVVFFALQVWPDYVAAHGTLGAIMLGGLLLLFILGCVAALVLTRADAVRILWDDLKRLLRFRRGRADVVDGAPRAP
jgi:membrane protease YdiL (CAAX protease family)